MRFFLVFSLCLVFLAASEAARARRKRFLRPENWALLPERLLRLSDHTFDFARSAHGFPASGLTDPFKRVGPLDAIFGPISRRDSNPSVVKTNATPKKNTQRELEDPEEGEGGKEEEKVSEVDVKEVIVDPPKREDENEKGTDDRRISIFNPFNINPVTFAFGILTPWWKGENVCVERNEVDESEPDDAANTGSFMINFEATQCTPTEASYICTKKIRSNGVRKTIIIKHQCCHGYAKRDYGTPGCGLVPMDDTIKTLKSLEASKFADMFERSGMSDKLWQENLTIFAPVNDAVTDFEEESENNEIMSAHPAKDYSYLVGGHIVRGLINLDTVENEDVLKSVNEKTTIRINKYRTASQMVRTANCVPISSNNNMAINGVIHVTTNILPLPRKTVADIVTASPKLSIFTKMLNNSPELLSELENAEKAWTIFVPTDKAFGNMEPEVMQKLLTGEGCVENILKHHLVKGTFCSAAVVGHFRVKNALGKVLTITRDQVEKIKIEDVRVSGTDILGTNGVVHFIDDVIIPPEAQSVLETLKSSKRDDLMELIKSADLESTFDSMQNVTFFIPSKDAVKAISNDTKEEWMKNPEKLKEILLYHLVTPQVPAAAFRQNQELPSLAEDQDVRIQLHEMFPGIALAATVQCAVIVNHDNEVCGAVLHVVDKVLTPPKGAIMEVLKGMEGHDTVIKLLESTKLESMLSNEGEGPYTLLAPTDDAFERFDKESLQELLENKTKAEQILRMHILPESLCCSGVSPVFPFRHHYVRTLEGNLLSVHRSGRNDRVKFGPARAVRCDVIARNGIVHSINRVILPNRRPLPSLFDIDIFSGLF